MTGPMINHERLKQTRAAGARTGAGWKPKDGENRIRVFPTHSKYLNAWDQMEDVAIYYEMHFFRIEGQKGVETTRCPKDLKLPCPACEAYWAHYKSNDPGLKQLIQQIKSARVYLMNVLDLGNVSAGIQRWSGNYSSWNAILEIVANPHFGNVLDPANGVNFILKLTPKSLSKTGFPVYELEPERDGGAAGPVLRTTVMNILAASPDWQQQLDSLEEQVTPMKTTAEIQALLDAMRVPGPAGFSAARPVAARPIAPPAGVVAAPVPVAAATAAPAPVGVAVPVAVMAAPVAVAVPVAAPVAVPAAAVAQAVPAAAVAQAVPAAGFQTAAPAASSTVHYDPGPEYVAKVPDEKRPAGAPRCFGDYNPAVHSCNHPCPVRGSCQMKMLGIA